MNDDLRPSQTIVTRTIVISCDYGQTFAIKFVAKLNVIKKLNIAESVQPTSGNFFLIAKLAITLNT